MAAAARLPWVEEKLGEKGCRVKEAWISRKGKEILWLLEIKGSAGLRGEFIFCNKINKT